MRITLTPEQKQGLQKDFNIQFEFAKESLEKYKATKMLVSYLIIFTLSVQ